MPELPPPPPPPLSLAGALVDAWRRASIGRHALGRHTTGMPGGLAPDDIAASHHLAHDDPHRPAHDGPHRLAHDDPDDPAHPALARHPLVPPVLAVACVILTVVVGGWLVLQRLTHGSSPPEIDLPRARPAATASATDGVDDDTAEPRTASADPQRGPVTAHAAGAVTHPGVYRLPAGARVKDLLDAAGGPTADAEIDALNLAAPLDDGQRVYVPRRGELPPGALLAAGDAVDGAAGIALGTGIAADGRSPPGDRPLDLNTATLAQLDELPGVGPTTAQAIIDHRRRKGRFRSVDELLEVRGIGPARLETLRKRVRV